MYALLPLFCNTVATYLSRGRHMDSLSRAEVQEALALVVERAQPQRKRRRNTTRSTGAASFAAAPAGVVPVQQVVAPRPQYPPARAPCQPYVAATVQDPWGTPVGTTPAKDPGQVLSAPMEEDPALVVPRAAPAAAWRRPCRALWSSVPTCLKVSWMQSW